MTQEMTIIGDEAYRAAKELISIALPAEKEILVVGCSTSEVGGAGIGTFSSPDLAEVVFGGIYQATQEAGIYLAAQCCEHLNRAIIIEREAAIAYGYERRRSVLRACQRSSPAKGRRLLRHSSIQGFRGTGSGRTYQGVFGYGYRRYPDRYAPEGCGGARADPYQPDR